MTYRQTLLLLGLVLVGSVGLVRAQLPRETRANRAVVAEQVDRDSSSPASAEHRLEPALRIARRCLTNIETNIRDYSATLVKRERVAGKLNETETLSIKVRHQPFSAYTYFKAPGHLQGQEAAYVAGKNGGNMQARGVGLQALVGVVNLNPASPLAMQGQRYPITELGVLNLAKRLIEAAEASKQDHDCEVKFFKDAKINKRRCTCIQLVHPTRQPQIDVHKALVYFDDELKIPVRYEAYGWPETPGGKPELIEQYTYVDVKLNVGCSDDEFELK